MGCSVIIHTAYVVAKKNLEAIGDFYQVSVRIA